MAPSWMFSTSPFLTTMKVGRPCTLYFLTVRGATRPSGGRGDRKSKEEKHEDKDPRQRRQVTGDSHELTQARIHPEEAQKTPQLQCQPHARVTKRQAEGRVPDDAPVVRAKERKETGRTRAQQSIWTYRTLGTAPCQSSPPSASRPGSSRSSPSWMWAKRRSVNVGETEGWSRTHKRERCTRAVREPALLICTPVAANRKLGPHEPQSYPDEEDRKK